MWNLVTKVVMTEKITNDLCQQSVYGQALFHDFIENRLKENISLWASMSKCQLQAWKPCGKKMKLRVDEKLQEDRSRFARMLAVSISMNYLNLKETIGKYELLVVPR